MSESLTSTQCRILQKIYDGRLASFTGHDARRLGFAVLPTRLFYKGQRSVLIRAYGLPEFFLARRGLIARVDVAFAGYWFVITDKGQSAYNKSWRAYR